jgi:CheY-like chemotaxis protein/HPt (histidine-containing phosphotransfer) domain-containing protein
MLAEELDEAQRRLVEATTSAEAASAAKTRFLAHMSHEIRTPLTALLGFADMLAAPTLGDSDRINYAMIVRRNGEHLLSVINDVLDLAKIEAQKLQVEIIDCSPVAVLGDVESLMRVRATERGLAFEVGLETPIPTVVRSDPTRLRQVLLNLVGNSIKFTEHGGVRLLASFEPGASVLRLTVADTGIGMTQAQLERLFRPFEQGDLSMTRRFGGSGLGLAISHALIVAMGGTIGATSTPGVGSQFTITLPVPVTDGLALVASLADGRRSSVAPDSPPTALTGTVLLVEDGPDNQILLTTLLRGYGLSVAIAENGAVALARALSAWRAGTPYDLVLMDMQMPVMDGYEATRRMRAEGYDGPVVAVTAHAMRDELERCLGAGCDEYVRKPIERTHLLTVLQRFLPRSPTVSAPNADEAPLVCEFADDPDMREIVERFVAALPDRVAAMRAALDTADPAALQRLAHQLKGAAGGFGFGPITEAAARLEAAVVGGDPRPSVDRALEAVADLCRRARAVRP